MKLATTLALTLVMLAGTAHAVDPPKAPEALREVKAKPMVVPIIKNTAPASIAVPNGSYLASCQNVRTEGDLVKASCQRKSGGRMDTEISVSSCAGVDIFNRNGTLYCVSPVRARWAGHVMPPGSYMNSCSGAVAGTTLRANCYTGGGDVSILGLDVVREGIRENSMDLTRCPDGSEIANLHGDLTCIAR